MIATGARGRTLALTLAGIVGVALLLRVVGLQYGLPAVYNPDEVAIMARALSFAKGTLNPHNFLYPTFYFYVLFGWVGLYLASVWVTGGVGSLRELQQSYFTDPTGIYTAGRALGAITGAITVLLVYRLAARLAGTRAAVAAAVFMAVSPLAVRDAHYVKHDVPATLAVVAAYLAMVRVWPGTGREDRVPPGTGAHSLRRNILLAGAACGVAFSTHYYCVFLALPLLWTIALSGRPYGWGYVVRSTALAALASAVVFLALSPFLAVEPVTAWRDITANRQIVVDRAVASGAFAPAMKYIGMLWRDAMGMPVIVLAAAGAAWMLATAPAKAILLLAFPVPFFLFITNTFPASRYLNPVLPFVAIFAGWALSALATRWRAPSWIFASAVVACAVPGTVSSIRSDMLFRQSDTRTLAQQYVEREIPAGSTILVQPYSVPLTPSREGLIEALSRQPGGPDAASTKFQLQLSLDPYPSPSYRLIYLGRGGLDAEKIYVDPAELVGSRGLDVLRQLGVAFVILKGYNASDPEMTSLVSALGREGRRIASFSPYRAGVPQAEQARIEPFLHNTDARIDEALERPGPTLEIWQLNGPGS